MTDLLREIRTVLARLELCSSAKTQTFNPGGGRSTDEHPGGKRPPGAAFTADEWFRYRLYDLDHGRPRRVPRKPGDNIKTRDTLELLLRDARAELAALTGRTEKQPRKRAALLDNDKGVEQAVLEDAPNKPAEQIATRLGVSVFLVRRIYITAGLDPHDGTPRDGVTDSEKQAKAREMADKGYTQRGIALVLEVNQATVSRWLGRHAA